MAVILEIIGDMIDERALAEKGTGREGWLHDQAEEVHERSATPLAGMAEKDRVGAETYSKSVWTTVLRAALWPLKST